MFREWVYLALVSSCTVLSCWSQSATASIDQKTAAQIAASAAVERYGVEEINAEYPLTELHGNDGTWEFYGTPCCPNVNGHHTCGVGKCVGGIVHVSVRQNDGKILSLEKIVMPRVIFKWLDEPAPQIIIYEWNSSGCGGGESGSYYGQGKRFILGQLCNQGPMRHAKLAIYASGCQSKRLDVDIPNFEASRTLRCDPLPNITIRGFIPPDQIPRVPFDQGPALLPLDILADLETGWMHEFVDGSSGKENISLKTVGVINPSRNGEFEIVIPDFSHDPSFSSYAASGRSYGLIKLRLHEKGGGWSWPIVPLDSLKPGLAVEAEYPDSIVFRVAR